MLLIPIIADAGSSDELERIGNLQINPWNRNLIERQIDSSNRLKSQRLGFGLVADAAEVGSGVHQCQ